MGCQGSKTEELEKQEKQNKSVESQLRKARTEYLTEIKLLLLGTGESGKSTIAKQMKILHTGGFSKSELLTFRPVVFNNTLTSMKTLVHAANNMGFEFEEKNKPIANYFEQVSPVELEQFTMEMANNVKVIWEDAAIQQAFQRRNQFQLMDGAQYCFENVDRFTAADYIPNEIDVLRVRARTTGIIETTVKGKGTTFRMVDVGGQRSERKKWIHFFEDVTAIIYCVALNEYDMKLFEDENVNRMQESLELFEEICNSKWFTKTAIVLFLNKSDLFKEKIAKVSLSVLFPDYTLPCDLENGTAFIQKKFALHNRNPDKKIFAHVTNATDTANVKVVFDAAKEIIISQNLERLGFGTL